MRAVEAESNRHRFPFCTTDSHAHRFGTDIFTSPGEHCAGFTQAAGQEFRVSYTTSPMKVIIDSNLPIADVSSLQSGSDVALKDIRYSEGIQGSRLVLDFNYQIPQGAIIEDEFPFRLEIPKTFANTTRRMSRTWRRLRASKRADSYGPNVVNYLRSICGTGLMSN